MDESEDNLSADDTIIGLTSTSVKSKPKKRSLVERELETSLTAHATSPMTNGDFSSTSRYGRALRLKTDSDFVDSDKIGMKSTKSPAVEKTPAKSQLSPVYKMHASNSPVKVDTTKRTPIKIENVDSNLENQIENIYNENISLSRFGSNEKRKLSPSNIPKLYVRKDLIQKKEKEETVTLIKNMFSPHSGQKASNSHLNNVLERSSEKYSLNSRKKAVPSNGLMNNSSVVKTLDFDSNKKKKETNKILLSKSDLFDLEAKCEYQVGDLAWARMGTFPFWPCIVTREPVSRMFVRKKLFGRIERDIIHVTFFGDNGRRSWIVDTMLRKFLGQLEFEATREHFCPTVKKKDPRLYAAFFVSEKKMPLWSISVEEAETLLREPKRLRIDIFNDMLAKSRSMKIAKSKSVKVARTNRNVSLSESLYDTLFSENDRQSEESDGSRSKTRKSLDVSEVVTACLDNMAAKTGMTKIQKQSHMDRWLQKAKSKTPEKSQVKLQVPAKEKERVVSSKKKRWEAPRNVSVKKPYSLRKSNESRHLMPHHNEHDYSTTDKEGELPGITFGIITKVESLRDKEDVKDSTTCNKDSSKETTAKGHTETNVTCESPTYTQDYDDLIFAHEINTDKSRKSPEITLNTEVVKRDLVNDINMSIAEGTNIDKKEISDVDNEQSPELQKHSNKNCDEIINTVNTINNETKQDSYLHMNGHSEDIVDCDANVGSKNIGVASVNDESLNNLNKNDDYEFKMDTESPKSVKETQANVLDSTTTSQCNGEVNWSAQSIEISDTDTSIDNLSQSLEHNDTFCSFVKPVVRSRPVKKRSLRLINRNKSNTKKIQDDGFAKYVELRRDVVMDENPDLSQEEIMEYLRKTWQYQKGETQDDKQKDTDHNKDRKKFENNNIKEKINTNNLKAKKKVCTVSLTDILLQNNLSVAFKNGEKTCFLPVIESSIKLNNTIQNDVSRDEIEPPNNISNKSLIHSNNKHLSNDKICNEIQNDSNTTNNIKFIKSNIEVMDTESQFNVSFKNDEQFDDNNTISSKIATYNLDSEVVHNAVDQEKCNSLTEAALDLETTLHHHSIDSEINSNKKENTVNKLKVVVHKESQSLKSTESEDEKTSVDMLNNVESLDTLEQLNVVLHDQGNSEKAESLKSTESEDEKTSVEMVNNVESLDTSEQFNVVLHDQGNSEKAESLKSTESENEKTSVEMLNNVVSLDTSEQQNVVLNDQGNSKEAESLKSTESENEKTSVEMLNNVVSLDTSEQQNVVLNDQGNSDKLLDNDSDSSKSEQQNHQYVCLLENKDSNSVPLECISPLLRNELPNEVATASKDELNLIKNDTEVDSILKSIDNFVNDKDSPTDILNSELEIDKCFQLPRTLNDDEKVVETTEMSNLEKRVSEGDSIENPLNFDNTFNNHGEQSVLNDVASVTEKNTLDKLKSEFSETDDVTVSNEHSMSLDGETSESKEIHPQNVSQPIKVNGFHSLDDCTPNVSDVELNAETSSIHSEDSEPLSILRSKLQTKSRQKIIKDRSNPDFLKYVEMRQDALIDEHPELNQEEIIDYMYKTWLYEENTKSDYMKTDDIEKSGLVKGLNDTLRQKSIRNSFKKRKPKPSCEDSISISSDTSDSSVKRKLRHRSVRSPVVTIENNQSKESSPERKLIDDIDDCKSINSDISENPTETNQLTEQHMKFNDSSKTDSIHHKDNQSNSLSLKIKIEDTYEQELQNDKTCDSEKAIQITLTKDCETKKYFDVFKQNKKINKNREIKTEFDVKVKEENDPDAVSIHSEYSEASLSKRKQRKYVDKEPNKEDPEFLKYLELRQDAIIDENPELSEEEIVSYLFKTWLYEESVKSDIKKSDELEQANLVKGLNGDTQQSKKIKKKIKVEKELTTDDDFIQKDKPKRKTSHPYYIEDELSDSEDIEMFDIFKSKQKPSTAGADEIIDVDDNDDVVDVVELYFLELTKPKPNVFKGLLREKVCEICEKTSNLVKCKGCNSMFHVDCVKKEVEVKTETPVPTRGRKKKKKLGRKSKNLDESESQSDEKSQEFSEDNNQSIEDVPEPESYIVDAENFESLLEVKMKELITTEANYDTSFNDCGITWNGAVAGKCEIVDVKLQLKIEPDYTDFKCNKCQKYDIPVCFVCKLATSKTGVEYRQRCQTAHCFRYYHMECLDQWPQTQFHARDLSKIGNKLNERFDEFMCPRHVCHTCVSDDPRGCKTRFSGDKLARCVRCPATYHSFTKCLPAGSQILTASHIVCPRHYEHRPGKVPCHVNTGWCFICALGGSLICCEYCPTSFHAECLNIKPPEGGYMCEDCETGRLPLYGEMVWVKLGHYRWWPGLILHPSEIPDNILAVKHSPGEFVVRFFGQYDHYWVNRGRVFPFQEGDSGRISSQKSKIDAAFTTAMEHAQRACEIMKRAVINSEEETDIASSLLPPHYVKLKVNKPVGSVVSRRADADESSLTQCDCSPHVDDPCGPYSHCLNRMLLTECGPSCRAGDRCNNRAFEKRLYPRMAPYKTPHRGWGLRTLEDIKAGQFVIEYVGELIDEEEFRRRMNRKHEIRDENFYFLTLDKERMIDAGPKGNLARFMNHCCEPNCETQKWTVLGDVRVGLFAINDIPAKSELTFNYNLECAGIEKKRCLCGAKRCSGYMGAKPKQDEPKKTKRTYNKKRKPAGESPSTSKNKPKRSVGRPAKPKELTEIEKDLLIIKNATNGLSSDSECSSRLSSMDSDKFSKALKRKRVDFSTEGDNTNSKKVKLDEEKPIEVGD